MKEIQLTRGMVALVDDEDYIFLAQWKWAYKDKGHRNTGYAVRGKSMPNGRYKVFAMHRVIMDALITHEIDHINGNGLDNRKENLRIATKAQNQMHKQLQRNNTSGYKGVYYSEKKGKWRSAIGYNNKGYKLGWYKTKEAAAEAYNRAAVKHHGAFAILNRIQETPTSGF